MKKLAIIVSHPIQHFAPVYQLLGKSKNIDLIVIYFTDAGAKKHFDKDFGKAVEWNINLLSGYRHIFLEPGQSVDQDFNKMSSPKLKEILDDEKPDAIMLYGYGMKLQWQAWKWARKKKKKILYFSDSTLVKFKRKLINRILKRIIVSTFLKPVDVFLAVGDRNEDYLKKYGADESKIIRCPLTVDCVRYNNPAVDYSETSKLLRRKYNLSKESFILLFSGKMIARKNPQDLIDVTLGLCEDGHDVAAIFLGSGELLEKLQNKYKNHKFGEKLIFTGFVNQKEIPDYLHASNCYVMTSTRDAHPLSVTEALACGLPVISTDNVGCVGPTDTVRHEVNGFVYLPCDIDELKRQILRLMNDKELYDSMSKASFEIAQTQDISVAARVIENVVK